MLRVLLLRERITLVHAHQAFSTLALEACLQARAMGYKVKAQLARPLLGACLSACTCHAWSLIER